MEVTSGKGPDRLAVSEGRSLAELVSTDGLSAAEAASDGTGLPSIRLAAVEIAGLVMARECICHHSPAPRMVATRRSTITTERPGRAIDSELDEKRRLSESTTFAEDGAGSGRRSRTGAGALRGGAA